jgi:integrase
VDTYSGKSGRALVYEIWDIPDELVARYAGARLGNGSLKGSPEWEKLAENTRVNYRIYLDRMVAAWGQLPARDLRPRHILAARDEMSETPFAANSFLAVGVTLFQWGVPREFADVNPFREIERIDTSDAGHIPWPRWAWEFCVKHAPEDLARFTYVALHTGQRESDVLRMGPPDRNGAGLWTKPKKTGKRRGRFWIPLTATALVEFERMEREPVTFVNPRFKAPIVSPTKDTYVFSPRGRPYNPQSLRSRWNRWLLKQDAGIELRRRWQEYCRQLAERAGEEFDPEEAKQPALHGLRGSAVVIRRMAGAAHQQIANDIGMSPQMVMHYSRFMDQKAAAESNIALLEEADRRRNRSP